MNKLVLLIVALFALVAYIQAETVMWSFRVKFDKIGIGDAIKMTKYYASTDPAEIEAAIEAASQAYLDWFERCSDVQVCFVFFFTLSYPLLHIYMTTLTILSKYHLHSSIDFLTLISTRLLIAIYISFILKILTFLILLTNLVHRIPNDRSTRR